MLTRFRRKLGKLKDQLERRVESGGKPRPVQAPITEADKNLLLQWLTGEVDDEAVVERAKTGADGAGVLERACAARPGNARMWAARAELSLKAGDCETALEQVEHAFTLGRVEPPVGLVYLRVHIAADRRKRALAALPELLENARHVSAHGARLEMCRYWQDLEPDSIEPLLESARTRVAAGELDTAIAEFRALHTAFGARTDVLLPLAAIYQDLVRTEDALRVYLEAVAAAPDSVDALCMAGACALDLRDTASADKLLSRAYEIDSNSPFGQYYLGLLRLDQGRIDEAAQLILGARSSIRGEPWNDDNFGANLVAPTKLNVADAEWTSARFKLTHDIEQFQYLRLKGLVGPALDAVIAEYQAVLRNPKLHEDANRMVVLEPTRYPLLARSYKSPLNAADPEPPRSPLVNPDLAWKDIEARYLDSKPNLVYIDDLLTPEALAAIRAYCLESTFWNQLKGGYLGANMPDGFSGRLLLRIASELRARMPRVIRDHSLQTMWGHKYDSRYAGMSVHADVAAINANFWITPDSANLDPQSGGLVVYSHDAPRDRNLWRLNIEREAIDAYLESVGAEKVKVPYRANRAVIFDSALFHETDTFRFREGYENRRVSVTMLYGTRAG